MKLTWIDLNSWIFQLGGKTILVDPWLVDPLVFYGQPWLFTAYHRITPVFTPETLPPIDLILLSQAVDDHCHVPTLKRLDRAIPVVASPTAAKVMDKLGFEHVTGLAHWQEWTIDQLRLRAIPGAEISPVQIENGFLLTDLTTSETLYYEPHSFPVAQANQIGRVDVAIAPIVGQILPLLGQVIMGADATLRMLEILRPKTFLPTTLGEVEANGILPMLIKSVGSVEEFRDRLAAAKLTTKFVVPHPGESIEISNG